MPKFITYFSYTSEAMKAMVERPSDRPAAAKALTESIGGTLEAFYWMTGPHDGLLIADLPDGVSAAALAAAVGSGGALHDIETYQLFDRDEQAAIVAGAATARAAYKPPTA